MPRSDIHHGTLVDRQIRRRVECEVRKLPVGRYLCGQLTDPCVDAFFAYLQEKGWRAVACQVPIYSPTLRVATAIDVVCTDVATESQLILLEVKSSRVGTHDSTFACYVGVPSSADVWTRPDCMANILGLPPTHHTVHQAQLWAMNFILRRDYQLPPDVSQVVRLVAGEPARGYDLNSVFVQHEHTHMCSVFWRPHADCTKSSTSVH